MLPGHEGARVSNSRHSHCRRHGWWQQGGGAYTRGAGVYSGGGVIIANKIGFRVYELLFGVGVQKRHDGWMKFTHTRGLADPQSRLVWGCAQR